MSLRYTRITYTAHAEMRLRERGISKALVATTLQTTAVIHPSRGVFVAEGRIPERDHLALKVVFSVPAPRHAHVITVHMTRTHR